MDIQGRPGFADQRGIVAQATTNQGLVNSGHGQQHGSRWLIQCSPAITEDQEIHLVQRGGYRLFFQAIQRGKQRCRALRAREGNIEHTRAISLALEFTKRCQLRLGQQGRIQVKLACVQFSFGQQAWTLAQIAVE